MSAALSKEVSACVYTHFIEPLDSFFGGNAFACDKFSPETTCELSQIEHCGKIQFVEYLVRRGVERSVGGCFDYIYDLTVNYRIEYNTCEDWGKVQEFFDELDSRIISDSVKESFDTCLGCRIGFYPVDNFPIIGFDRPIEGKMIYLGTRQYRGI